VSGSGRCSRRRRPRRSSMWSRRPCSVPVISIC
jgi:hypothetical protein